MPIISIIVPIYKVEKYIHNCINSILAQTFEDFELILINDGSPDNCGEICNDFARMDNRIKVLHKENGGLSDARNAGLNIAQGEYIAFVDGDDWIEKDMYKILYQNIKKYNADISVCKYREVSGYSEIDSVITNNCKVFNNKEAFDCLFNNKYFASHACDKLYKKELFDNIQYPKGKLYEDMFTTYKLFEKINKVVYSNYIGYNYFQRKDGIVKSKFKIEKLDYLNAFEGIFDLCVDKYPQSKKAVTSAFILANISLLGEMCRDNFRDKIIKSNIEKKVRKHLLFFCCNGNVPIKSKVIAIVIAINYRIFEVIKNIRYKINMN
ncbi:glycosyltransferase family 2 protein [Neobacillus drentensis]|uniref:glycosyltransferase family 2 protein n=1 Tax=Neobacillus drentensis TaxID=220684 RepID=UPI002FFF58C2